ncbi:MAG: CAP domain-containing protein [Pseudomonadota bacterium]
MSNLSPYEQYLLELINRARENPNAEAARFGIGLNDGLDPGTITGNSKQPLAGSGMLERAATLHSAWMLDTDTFSHTGQGGSSAGDRIEAAGYTNWSAWGENIAYAGTTGTFTNGVEWIELHHEGLFKSEGHRENLLADVFDTVGLGQVLGRFEKYNTSMVTQNFATDGGSPFVLGVVYEDLNGDNFYQPGEELSGVTVTTSDGDSTVTGAGGGYEIRVDGNETLTLTFSGGDLAGSYTETVTIANKNVKVDLDIDDQPLAAEAAGPTGGLEVGTATTAQAGWNAWTSVTFAEAIEDAVVVMGPLSSNGSDQSVVRVRNVTDTGFEFQIDEWDYLDGWHAPETVSWIAISEGTHQLADGRTISAGEVRAVNSSPVQVSLDGMDSDVVVMAQVASFNGPAAVTDRISNVGQTGFTVRMQEEEAADRQHSPETVSWIAIEEGGATGSLWAGSTDSPVNHHRTRIDLDGSIADAALIADMQTMRGTDTAALRYQDLAANGVTIRVEEEKSLNAEMAHAHEDIGWIVAEEGQYDLFAFV